jgi:cell division septal protein FtsQ
VKEGNTKRQSAVWVVTSGGVLIAAAIIAFCTPWPQLCDVRQVVVSGNRYASAAELVALSQLHRGQTVFSISATAIARRVEQHPWVKRASVRRIFPHTIQLVIEERQLIAWSQHPADGSRIAVAEGGVVVDAGESSAPSLELIGAAFSDWHAGGRLVEPLVSGLLTQLQRNICQFAVRRLDVTDLRSIELFLENDTRVRLGDILHACDRLKVLDALCQGIGIIDGYELIDVRFGGEATLVPRKAVRR